MAYPIVNEEECITCGLCESTCPANPNVFEIEDVSKVVNPESCVGCENCVRECPLGCIKLKES
ncbi:DUF362 domain-containing protein [Natroniella sp. ANB-PHB2]|uniref:DUF362 domain-containing protein n=1 Tax=Natroniella sp. ANB-PHB2 TaxID=3384444 RepID=UPI0038D3899E